MYKGLSREESIHPSSESNGEHCYGFLEDDHELQSVSHCDVLWRTGEWKCEDAS